MPHALYHRLTLGDPHAFAAARQLSSRVRFGAATPGELRAYATLRELHAAHAPAPSARPDISPATLARLGGAIARARPQGRLPQATIGAGHHGGGHHGGGGYRGGWGGWGWPGYYAAPPMLPPCVWSPVLGRYLCYVAGYGWMPV